MFEIFRGRIATTLREYLKIIWGFSTNCASSRPPNGMLTLIKPPSSNESTLPKTTAHKCDVSENQIIASCPNNIMDVHVQAAGWSASVSDMGMPVDTLEAIARVSNTPVMTAHSCSKVRRRKTATCHVKCVFYVTTGAKYLLKPSAVAPSCSTHVKLQVVLITKVATICHTAVENL